MTNNTPDYEDNLYFDCKNCKMTDEYCASGDCERDTMIIEKQVWKYPLSHALELQEQKAQLKDLLNEWVQFEIEENPNDFTVMSERMSELANKTKEVLKCQE